MVSQNTPCLKCREPSIAFIRYSGAHLCREHFLEFVTKRIKKEIRAQKILSGGTIAVALSGGKDSIVTLKVLREVSSQHRGVELEAILVDEGIKGYRPTSIDIAKRYCDEWDIKLHIISFKDLVGHDLDTMIANIKDHNPCSICGVFRRTCINQVAKEIGATMVATGHNLDDISQSILMNVIGGDIDKIFRLGPHLKTIEGLVPRVFPLRTIPEKEVLLYALLNGIKLHMQECPYSINATRGRFRDHLSKLELESPGTKHSLLNFHQGLMERCGNNTRPDSISRCTKCNEPTSSSLCKSCELQVVVRDQLVDKSD